MQMCVMSHQNPLINTAARVMTGKCDGPTDGTKTFYSCYVGGILLKFKSILLVVPPESGLPEDGRILNVITLHILK